MYPFLLERDWSTTVFWKYSRCQGQCLCAHQKSSVALYLWEQIFRRNQKQITAVQILSGCGWSCCGVWGWERRKEGQKVKVRFILLWLEISVNYAQVVQMVEGQGQLCKVEFHIFLCKHNLIRTGQIYSLNSEEETNSAAKRKNFRNHKQREQSIIIVTISTFQKG